ncbi:MAG: hypothetical protein ACLPJJ_00850 [Acidocella sp.]|uniref:hypothetical protein n=1 Tax=Acidocella sp. TaxID=50710 RepID=UPI003FD6CAA1
MDPNTSLTDAVLQEIGQSIETVAGLTETELKRSADELARLREEVATETVRLARSDLSSMSVIVNELRRASATVRDRNKDITDAIGALVSARALATAKIAEFELCAAASGTSTPLSTWLQTIKSWLGHLVNWIWTIIQTMVTPKGWSIAGGVTVHGLANAQLTIEFG